MDRRMEIKQWLKNILDKYLSGMSYNAFIFGSQANKPALSRSDIDLGIIADSYISKEKIALIHKDIQQLPMLLKVDVVDFNDVDESFKKIALSNLEVL
jgi:predicted nucleotidyltransferase